MKNNQIEPSLTHFVFLLLVQTAATLTYIRLCDMNFDPLRIAG